MTEFELEACGPFSLAAAQDFAGGFPAGIGGGAVDELSIAMSFPLESWQGSAAVELRQLADGRVVGRTDAPSSALQGAKRQAARALSLDHDGSGWSDVGDRDPVVGRFQRKFGYLRPLCFYSAYEAATSFVIGQRISMRQSAKVKERLREETGEHPTVDGHAYSAFPGPQRLIDLAEIAGVSAKKTAWLHGIARAALDGRLDTETLRNMPHDEAVASLRSIPGIGPFTADGILFRGCGVVDELPSDDEVTLRAVAALYDRTTVSSADLHSIAEAWRPYRMWAVVLLRVAWNREFGRASYRNDGHPD